MYQEAGKARTGCLSSTSLAEDIPKKFLKKDIVNARPASLFVVKSEKRTRLVEVCESGN